MFVLSRALLGAIRAAVMEEQPFLRSRSFEDELVRLVMVLSRVDCTQRRADFVSSTHGEVGDFILPVQAMRIGRISASLRE